MIKAVLLDDEVLSCRLLQKKITETSRSIEIIGYYTDPAILKAEINTLQPDVLFLDIEMPMLSGFEFLEELEEVNFEVVFVTAHNDFVLQALRVSALDFLLKPVDPEELAVTLQRLEKKLQEKTGNHTDDQQHQLQMLENMLEQKTNAPSRIALTTTSGIKFIKLEDIIRVEASSNYSVFHLLQQPKITASKTLKEFEFLIAFPQFYRVSRSTIVNLHYVVELIKAEGGYLILEDGTEIDLSAGRREELVKRMTNL